MKVGHLVSIKKNGWHYITAFILWLDAKIGIKFSNEKELYQRNIISLHAGKKKKSEVIFTVSDMETREMQDS